MNSYRLLRSNKESGPFTQDQIIGMGFKPYDLIWVEGKSAGWRYPSEIPELKAYAPVVEEQPYDRFFKKPVVPARGTPLPQNVLAADLPQGTEQVFPSEPVRPAYTPASLQLVGRHIHVTLPSGNTLNVTTMSGHKEQVAEKPVSYTPEEKLPSFTETISAVPLTPVTETLVAAKAAKPAEKQDNDTGAASYYPTPAPTYSWSTLAGLVTGIATLVGLGVMIGLSINRGNAEPAHALAVQPTQTIAAPVSAPPVATNALPGKAVLPAVNTATEPPPPTQKQAEALATKDAGANHHKTASTVKKDINQLSGKPVDKPVADNQPLAREPVVVRPKQSEVVQAVNLEKQVNIVTNGYKVGAFGGISGLQCTVVNDSRFALDVVEVELQYIQANDKVFKTEKLSFRDVAAGGQLTISAPKSSRGVKIVSHIVKINSKEPGLANITVKS